MASGMATYQKLSSSPPSDDSNCDSNSDSDIHSLEVEDRQQRSRSETSLARFAAHLLVAFCLVCTAINVGMFFILATGSIPSATTLDLHTAVSRDDIANLRRPSQFIRFDEIKRPSPPIPRQFTNHPILIAQVDSNQPDHVFGEVKRRYTVHAGTMTPEDRRVLVTQTISTVVQFRAIDYGMGSCELHLTVPASVINGTHSGLLDDGQSRPLSIYRLNSTSPIRARSLSASNIPSRVAKVAEISLQHEEGTDDLTWYRKFECAEDEILTFELVCGTSSYSNPCNIEWWQDRAAPNPAIFFVQHSTV